MAEEKDTAALLDIYAYYVENTAVTFEYEVPALEEFAMRIYRIKERYPYILAEENGEIAGYACVSAFKDRAAYDWAVETTVYVKQDRRTAGIGRRLYEVLEDIVKAQNILNLNACIAYPNPDSISFHEHLGYKTVAHFTKCGFKQGRWYDMVWMEKMIGKHPDNPKQVIRTADIDKGVLGKIMGRARWTD